MTAVARPGNGQDEGPLFLCEPCSVDDHHRCVGRCDCTHASARAGGGEQQREQVARLLFAEFVTGLDDAWDTSEHYRGECYRVADELLALLDQPTSGGETR